MGTLGALLGVLVIACVGWWLDERRERRMRRKLRDFFGKDVL